MRKITLVIMLMLFCFAGNSQTSLAPGDIAFIGSNADGVTNADDSFAFVLLKDIDAATQIIFTDKGWNDDTGFTNFPGDGEFVWTSGVARQANDIVTVSLTPLFPAAYALIGDQLFALQGSTALPTFIAGLQYNNEISSNDSNWDGASVDNATSALPDALTTGENAVRLINGAGLEQDNWQFDCDLLPGGVTLTGSKDELGVIINNRTYWSSNNTNVYNPVVKGTCVYSVLSDPTITFAAINKNYGDANFNLNATSNSAGTISYSIVGAANGTVLSGTNNATVTLGNVGDITIRASQTADGIFSSGSMDTTLSIVKADQTITFGALAGKAFGDADFNLTASASSGLTVSYISSNTDVATVSGNTVTIVGAGTTNITASQIGDTNYNAATDVSQSLTVGKADQTITFGALAGKDFGDTDFNLTASASSGLTVSYISSNTDVATVSGNTVTIVGAGTTNITASQIGDTNYNTATDVSQSLTVGKADQTITFGALAGKDFGDTDFNLTASASSGLTVSYISSNTDVATVSGNTVTIVGAGTTNITASQIGDTNYNAATDVSQSLTVGKADQTITFGALAGKDFGDADFNLTASASSGLTVSYVSSNTDVATVSGNTVTIVGAGTTNITASQVGDTNYNAATDVSQSLTVGKADQTITFGALIGKTVGDDPFTLTGSSSSGLTISYVSSNPLVATVTGNTVTIVGAGNTIITASQIGDTDYNAATDVPQNLNVGTTLGVDNFNLASVSMFPNPAQDVITLQNPEKLNLKLLTIYDLAGRLMQKEDLTIMGSEKILNVSGLSTATYLVIIESEKGNLTKLLIKK